MPSIVLRNSLVSSPRVAIGRTEGVRHSKVTKKRQQSDLFMPEMVPRNCKLEEYQQRKVSAVEVDDQVLAYCSPDSTYAVTKRLFDAAKKEIVIGIYDFSASHMKELLLNALQRNVRVKLMLDIDSDEEQQLFDELCDLGIEGVPAPSCASLRARYFSSSHEKVIVIDSEWVLVQSGNYSDNSIPLNVMDGGDPENYRRGNRDTGLAIRSRKLAKFFTKILESDMALEVSGPEALGAVAPTTSGFLVERAPTKLPTKFFPSKVFDLDKPLTIQPILSPDNYMTIVPSLLRAARKSILIEQQYIRGSQDQIAKLLEAIQAAWYKKGDLDIRIVLGKVFNKKDMIKEEQNLSLLRETYGLKLGKNIRFLDTSRFVHCHNKMVLIDGKGVLISSQNWSNSAVTANREAGVWLEHSGICGYFSKIFESDWETALKNIPGSAKETVKPESLRAGGYVRVAPADYQEV